MIVVDRIEEGTAVLEIDGKLQNVPLCELPAGTREGSLLVRTADGFALDHETEKALREEIALRTKRLFRKL